jgi:hypothetical protein
MFTDQTPIESFFKKKQGIFHHHSCVAVVIFMNEIKFFFEKASLGSFFSVYTTFRR